MANLKRIVLLYGLLAGGIGVATSKGCLSRPLVKTAGEVAAVPTWDVQSTSKVSADPLVLSEPGVDVSSWHHAKLSRCTLMACLIAAGVYNEVDLFMSDNLNKVDDGQFRAPWLYRNEFVLKPGPGQHYFLQTNGVTSRADVFLNGHKVADSTTQAGAYGGHSYDITGIVNVSNALVFQVYPTDYLKDFGVGFVDWNPAPPDNGTGVWRDVNIRQTGPVSLGPLRVVTKFGKSDGSAGARAVATLKATVENLENRTITLDAVGTVSEGAAGQPLSSSKSLTLQPFASGELQLETTIDNAALWWPVRWGGQTLYTAQLSIFVDNKVSDKTERKFGVREVTHHLNSFNDSSYTINGRPFQVRGGGYSADMFLCWDKAYFTSQMQYVMDMGLNTIRLEGKMEHPELYEITDQLGIMVMPGWECCDKWEGWSYNDNLPPHPNWTAADYAVANASMYHEAAMLQTHPSVLHFSVGSDFWPDDEAASIYVSALRAMDWPNPIIPYAAKKDGYPAIVGPPGMKMDGPYDWVPPNYWWDTQPYESHLGAAFGFGSELGGGVGTPELSSLKRFLSPNDLTNLWQHPNISMLHMTTNTSDFSTRTIYNTGLYHRYGAPTSLEDYLLKAQIMDYEATRSQFEAYSGLWNAARPATGAIYWMLNNAWPGLHWAFYDYYLHPAGAYFGAKVAGRNEHVAFDYVKKSVYLINHSLDQSGPRSITWEVVGLDGKSVSKGTVSAVTEPNKSRAVVDLSKITNRPQNVVFLRLTLSEPTNNNKPLSRNVYWLAPTFDTLDWSFDGDASWYYTPVTSFADFSSLSRLPKATVSTMLSSSANGNGLRVIVKNTASVPAFFIRLNLVAGGGEDITPVLWSDNYVTLWPKEELELSVSWTGGARPTAVQFSGWNVERRTAAVPGSS
ncbi:hypothetical protein DL546_007574 [Coniochaeta pulveracea]|uniref:Uncharacterized protein n=1 Tax=Coniochaeta pulveracea TaxID=177199 RepID=A0A420YBP4_9PEZI|nr:hypothetical protein DL546_007574 [Coniochaeta pulveracea]